MTRTGIVLTIAGLAAYATGLQKLVLDPVLSGFRDLDPPVQLLVLVGIVALVAGLLVARARSRRTELARAQVTVAAHLEGTAPHASAVVTDAP